MGRHVHVLVSKDPESMTGECRACGPVALAYRTVHGERVVRCRTAVESQRESPNANRGWAGWPKPHGLTAEEARAARAAAGCCEVCGDAAELHVDHDHVTGWRRGVLCKRHNVGLGIFRDSVDELLATVAYLRKYSRYGDAPAD